MELKPITVDLSEYPSKLHPYLDGAKLDFMDKETINPLVEYVKKINSGADA